MMLATLVLSLALGADVYHDAGDPYVEVRASARSWGVWLSSAGVGGEGTVRWRRFDFGLGLEYGPARWEVQSNLAYNLRVEYAISQKWGVGVKHRSNCKTVCPALKLDFMSLGNDGRNTGYNWLYLRRKF